ncbi:MAG TPA: glycosyltransferase family 9 protein [Gammaproteobacteria bacterium]
MSAGNGPVSACREAARLDADARGSLDGKNAWLRARRLLVIRADNIGDVVMTGPALRAIRRALPDAELTLLASPAGAEAAPLLPWIDDVICRRVLWQDLGRLAFDPARERALIEELEARRFDGAVILTSFSQSPHPAALVAWLAGIPLRAGASREESTVLTHRTPFGPFERHQAERNLALVAALGFPVDDGALEIRVPTDADGRAAEMLAAHGVGGTPYLLWNPWASAAARTYDPIRGADAARAIAEAADMRVVITAHARDADDAARLAERIGVRAIDLGGRTSVTELAALVARAAVVLTSHTSVMHLADALRVPVVVPFSGTDLLAQWTPRHGPHVVLSRTTDCTPCYAFECPRGHECLPFTPHEVARAALALLERSAASPAPRREDAHA